MSIHTFLFTSESVGAGHPDKICDQISDAIVDAHLSQDSNARVAAEVMVTTGTVILCGEVLSSASIDYDCLVRNVVRDIGYDSSVKCFDYNNITVMNMIKKQSMDIHNAVDKEIDSNNNSIDNIKSNDININNNYNFIKNNIDNYNLYNNIDMIDKNIDNNIDTLNEDIYKDMIMGAGDQGMMFGYATDECKEMIPISLLLSHKISECLSENDDNRFGPDNKCQVTIEYAQECGVLRARRVHTIVASIQHREGISVDEVRAYLRKQIKSMVPVDLLLDTNFVLQPSGRFVIGGPAGDAGLTGRKIIVDSYGGFGNTGGGCYSGKDYTKVDRSGSYMARWIAKSLVYNGICARVLIQISYAIGVADPISILVDTYGTGVLPEDTIIEIIKANFNMRPGMIKRQLGLDKPIYRKTATYGHFGREIFPWEKPKNLKIPDHEGI